ncbi:hypothetical protein [Oceanobacillus sp. CF4.6]|uniref:hypothetical protein n=1 Tax=Oceanobacillus sp. CF4.6 TaxID=3373080 RepID=UPI003EE732B0
MIPELERAYKLVHSVYAMDYKDEMALNEVKSTIPKVINELNRLREENDKLRQHVGRNIS